MADFGNAVDSFTNCESDIDVQSRPSRSVKRLAFSAILVIACLHAGVESRWQSGGKDAHCSASGENMSPGEVMLPGDSVLPDPIALPDPIVLPDDAVPAGAPVISNDAVLSSNKRMESFVGVPVPLATYPSSPSAPFRLVECTFNSAIASASTPAYGSGVGAAIAARSAQPNGSSNPRRFICASCSWSYGHEWPGEDGTATRLESESTPRLSTVRSRNAFASSTPFSASSLRYCTATDRSAFRIAMPRASFSARILALFR